MNERLSLETLADVNDLVLFDASVILGPIIDQRKLDHNEYLNLLRSEFDFFFSMDYHVNNSGHVFMTSKILSELSGPLRKPPLRDREELKIKRNLEKLRRGLCCDFLKKKKVIHLGNIEEGIYSDLKSEYYPIMYNLRLSEPDMDFLLTGMTLAKSHGRRYVALVSNDVRGIFHAREDIIRKENSSGLQSRFPLYIREYSDEFKRIG